MRVRRRPPPLGNGRTRRRRSGRHVIEFSGQRIEWAAAFATLINDRTAGHKHGVAMLT
ncbi:hypothetical protein [Streptomyces sp. NPDC001401]|uniref:hypothetical protein n=1 Tax=Streptomyces sp. NPDC001401 TaxID=3364570 RepID=UPI0036ABA0CA